MIWVLFIIVAMLVIGGFAALIAGRVGYDPLSEPTMTPRDPGLPEPFTARDVTAVRFDTAMRGYRMDQVDAVLHRLQDRITELESRAGSGDGTGDLQAETSPPAPDAAPADHGEHAP